MNALPHAERSALAQLVLCPTCRDPLPGLLAPCPKPVCRTAEVAEDAAMDRRCGDL